MEQKYNFNQDNQEFSPDIPTNDAVGTPLPSGAGTAPAAQVPTETAIPKSLHQCPSGTSNQIQTAQDQQTLLAWDKNLLPIATVNSRWRPFLAQATPTQITPGQATTCLQDRTTTCNLRNTLMNLRRCTGTAGQISRGFPHPGSSSPTPTRSTLWSSPEKRPTWTKKIEIMTLRHRYWPSHPRCTHPK